MLIVSLLAQAAVAAAPQQGVISYPAAFFAGQQVANANEMLVRVPGFQLDTGKSVRGYEGAGVAMLAGSLPMVVVAGALTWRWLVRDEEEAGAAVG